MSARKNRNTRARSTGSTPGTKRKKKAAKSTRKPFIWSAFRWCIVLALWGIIVGGLITAWYAKDLRDITASPQFERKTAITVKAADGSILTRYGELRGMVIPIHEMPKELILAVMAIEDRRFYEHFGIDPLGIARAAYTNIVKGGVVQGGSTITQQLAKNLFLSHERTIRRKIQEVLLAIWLEHELTKDEILTAYLNRVYFGSGAYGIEAAANTYFGISAQKLNLRQSAMLAGLLKAPSRYSPLNNPQLADQRANTVIAAMHDAGYINSADRDSGRDSIYTPPPGRSNIASREFRYFTDYVIDQLHDLIGTPQEDLIVETTMVPEIQTAAEQAIINILDSEGAERKVSQGASLVMHKDGAIVAMVGGKDYGKSQFNRATQAYRPTGSAFKPFVYLAALEKGWRASDFILDAPLTKGKYRPKNFANQYFGEVTLDESLTRSLNTSTVRLAEQAGIDSVIEMARRLGIEADLNRDLSLALGSSGIPLIEMTRAYAVIAKEGRTVTPFSITRITNTDGDLYYQRTSKEPGQYVLDLRPVREMDRMLGNVVEHGTGQAARLDTHDAHGKTGTSQDYRDAWFIGYTKEYVAGVWFGNDDNSPMNSVTGGSLPARAWKTTMQAALEADAPSVASFSETASGFGSLLSRILNTSEPTNRSERGLNR